jgi:hypothetical protein
MNSRMGPCGAVLLAVAMLMTTSGCMTLRETFNPTVSKESLAQPTTKKALVKKSPRSTPAKIASRKAVVRKAPAAPTEEHGLDFGSNDSADRALIELGAWERGYDISETR